MAALSYTEAPLEEGPDGELVRVEKHKAPLLGFIALAANQSAHSSGSPYKSFTLTTSIYRFYNNAPYTYLAETYGVWKGTSLLGDGNPGAAGDDYVLQSCPEMILSDACLAYYKQAGITFEGRLGKEYRRENAENSYSRYAISGSYSYSILNLGQLNQFLLQTTHQANAATTYKRINSYYVHTWDQMSLNVTPNGKVGKDSSIILNLSTSKDKKQWQLADFVAYKF